MQMRAQKRDEEEDKGKLDGRGKRKENGGKQMTYALRSLITPEIEIEYIIRNLQYVLYNLLFIQKLKEPWEGQIWLE